MRLAPALCLSLVVPLAGADRIDQLPAWAQGPAREAAPEAAPAGAEAWVLLQRQELTYAGDGTVLIHSQRLVRIIRGKGMDEGAYVQGGLLEGSLRIRELKGWNLRPDGELIRLESRDRFSFGERSGATYDRRTVDAGVLRRVAEGSLVAFEAVLEFKSLMGALAFPLMERNPVRSWELRTATGAASVPAQVRVEQLAPWVAAPAGPAGDGLRLTGIPALPPAEPGCAVPGRFLPGVRVRFNDPHWPGSRILDSWDSLGGWYQALFAPKVLPVPAWKPAPSQGLAGLQALWSQFGRTLVYKQVYLSPERDNVPEPAPEVARKGYGDCKDLACLWLALARGAGFDGHPVLARIQGGPVLDGESAGPAQDLFDHAIAALRLERSLGLAAEVETAAGRFLLVDATDPFTPLGQLSAAHRGARLLICLPGAGQWVTVPPAAVPAGRVELTLNGGIDARGCLKAELRLSETGNHWGLRWAAQGTTATGFREFLEARILDQAINGKCEVLRKGDPLDLTRPFTVDLAITDPGALTASGSAWAFKPCAGLPALPAAFTQPGRKRQLPVLSRRDGQVLLSGRLDLPMALTPILPEHRETTAFRNLAWHLATAPSATGCTLTFRVEEERSDTFFGLAELEQGGQAWRKDRALVRSLLEDGLALRP